MDIAARFSFGALNPWWRGHTVLRVSREQPATRPAPSLLSRAYRARAMLAQVRRSVLMLLSSEDCGLPLVLEDVQALDAQLAALGVQPTGLDAAEIALIGHECRQVYREVWEARGVQAHHATPRRPDGAPLSHAMSLRWARARQLQADTELELLKQLRASDSRLEFLMRANVAPRRAA